VSILLLSICVGAFIFAWGLCLLISKPSSIFYVLDEVTSRSLHTKPVPRTGGVALVGVITLIWFSTVFLNKEEVFQYYAIIGMLLLATVSFFDDRNSLPRVLRLFVHFMVALLMLYSLVVSIKDTPLSDISVVFCLVNGFFILLTIVWSINLYNFMDGMDGLAGGMAVIGFSCLAWLGWCAGNSLYLLLVGTVAAANMGFLVHNFPPAKLFMGDTGSTVMGYLAAFFSLWGIQATIFEWWCPILIFSPFLLDASFTLLGRVYRREKFWVAHKSHYYQKLVQIIGHTKTVLISYILMVSVACTAILIHYVGNNIFTIIMLSAWLIIYFYIARSINHLASKFGVLG